MDEVPLKGGPWGQRGNQSHHPGIESWRRCSNGPEMEPIKPSKVLDDFLASECTSYKLEKSFLSFIQLFLIYKIPLISNSNIYTSFTCVFNHTALPKSSQCSFIASIRPKPGSPDQPERAAELGDALNHLVSHLKAEKLQLVENGSC